MVTPASSGPALPVPAPKRRSWAIVGRGLLLVVGLVATWAMVREIGWSQIVEVVLRTAPFIPLICALDLLWVALEGGAVLAVYGEERARIPKRAWIFITLVHYATFMLFPLGRAAAEVTRATLVKKYVDRGRTLVGVALMQSLTLVSNGIVCLIAAICVFSALGPQILFGALMLNAALMWTIGSATYLVLRHIRVGGFFGKKFAKLAAAGPGFDEQFRASKPSHGWALGFCILGRAVQTLQYGVILLAVSGRVSVPHAWIAEGIQMVARSAGDFIPNQVGVTEGAFLFFRAALDLLHAPAVAVSIALVARISNMIVATSCIVLAQIWPESKTLRITAEGLEEG